MLRRACRLEVVKQQQQQQPNTEMMQSLAPALAWRALSGLSGVLGTSSALNLAVSVANSLDWRSCRDLSSQFLMLMTTLFACAGPGPLKTMHCIWFACINALRRVPRAAA
jgi:hypothetical protein